MPKSIPRRGRTAAWPAALPGYPALPPLRPPRTSFAACPNRRFCPPFSQFRRSPRFPRTSGRPQAHTAPPPFRLRRPPLPPHKKALPCAESWSRTPVFSPSPAQRRKPQSRMRFQAAPYRLRHRSALQARRSAPPVRRTDTARPPVPCPDHGLSVRRGPRAPRPAPCSSPTASAQGQG